jgi:hypothetical protein
LPTDVSEQTGGRHFVVENLNELPDVAAKNRNRATIEVGDLDGMRRIGEIHDRYAALVP